MSKDKKDAMTNSIQPHSIACNGVIHKVRKSGLEWPLALFIGPESDHWLCLSLTDSLTHSCLVNLINVSLACEDGNSKLVEVYSATYGIQFLKVMKSFSRLESHS